MSLSTMLPVNAAAAKFHVDLNGDEETTAPRAQDDFYLSQNFDWMKASVIPETKIDIGSLENMSELSAQRLLEITKDCVKNRSQYSKTSDQGKIADFYSQYLDMDSRNKAGYGNLSSILDLVESAQDTASLTKVSAVLLHTYGIPFLVDKISPEEDPLGISSTYIACDSGPALDFNKIAFLSDSYAEYVNILRDHIRNLLVLYGRDENTASSEADSMIEIEREIWAASQDKTAQKNPSAYYKTYTYDQLKAMHKNIDIDVILQETGMTPENGATTFMVPEAGAVEKADELYTAENLPVLKDYLIYWILDTYSGNLTQAYEDEGLAYYRKLTGTTEDDPADRRASQKVSNLLYSSYGRLYAKQYCSEKARTEVKGYVKKIVAQYRTMLAGLDWMSEATKQRAILKLDTITINVGWPNVWPDSYLDNYSVKSPKEGGSLINNYLDYKIITVRQQYSLFGTKVDKKTWPDDRKVVPQNVNAFYDAASNSINILAGVMQAPFYDPDATDATNLGGIGMVVAHEITHAFDAKGSQYDETGRLNNWWTDADRAAFTERTAAISEYFSRYELGSLGMLSGELTLSENIADLGALQCITAIIGENNTDEIRQCYTNYAVCWRTIGRKSYYLSGLTDEHSPDPVRVDGVLSNLNAFYTAFDVKPGDGMYVAPEDRVGIW
ncbi:MAG: M13 family metallopeptidase [Lachnospiraceae bacterium]|nr:M13 family metallopeptidase [Lachnospiraceae bacterium]